jgi:hypothetical protein
MQASRRLVLLGAALLMMASALVLVASESVGVAAEPGAAGAVCSVGVTARDLSVGPTVSVDCVLDGPPAAGVPVEVGAVLHRFPIVADNVEVCDRVDAVVTGWDAAAVAAGYDTATGELHLAGPAEIPGAVIGAGCGTGVLRFVDFDGVSSWWTGGAIEGRVNHVGLGGGGGAFRWCVAGPRSADVGEVVVFDGSCSFDVAEVAEVVWTLPDGSVVTTGTDVTWVAGSDGVHVVRAEFRGGDGVVLGSASTVVSVGDTAPQSGCVLGVGGIGRGGPLPVSVMCRFPYGWAPPAELLRVEAEHYRWWDMHVNQSCDRHWFGLVDFSAEDVADGWDPQTRTLRLAGTAPGVIPYSTSTCFSSPQPFPRINAGEVSDFRLSGAGLLGPPDVALIGPAVMLGNDVSPCIAGPDAAGLGEAVTVSVACSGGLAGVGSVGWHLPGGSVTVADPGPVTVTAGGQPGWLVAQADFYANPGAVGYLGSRSVVVPVDGGRDTGCILGVSERSRLDVFDLSVECRFGQGTVPDLSAPIDVMAYHQRGPSTPVGTSCDSREGFVHRFDTEDLSAGWDPVRRTLELQATVPAGGYPESAYSCGVRPLTWLDGYDPSGWRLKLLATNTYLTPDAVVVGEGRFPDQPSDALVIVALGDSYQSGEGIGTPVYPQDDYLRVYENGRNYPDAAGAQVNTYTNAVQNELLDEVALGPGDECHRGLANYAKLLADRLGDPSQEVVLVDVTCSGAKIAPAPGDPKPPIVGPVGEPGYAAGSQVDQALDRLAQLGLSAADVDVVTVGMGGNDAGFASILENCVTVNVLQHAIDAYAAAPISMTGLVNVMSCSNVEGLLGPDPDAAIDGLFDKELWAQRVLLGEFRDADIVQVEYPDILPSAWEKWPERVEWCGGISRRDFDTARDKLTRINDAIADAAAVTSAESGGRLQLVAMESAFGSGALCPQGLRTPLANGIARANLGTEIDRLLNTDGTGDAQFRQLLDRLAEKWGDAQNACPYSFHNQLCWDKVAQAKSALDDLRNYLFSPDGAVLDTVFANLVEPAATASESPDIRYDRSRGLFHPNGLGFEVQACRIEAQYVDGIADKNCLVGTAAMPETTVNGVEEWAHPHLVSPGDSLSIRMGGFGGGRAVSVLLKSAPQHLATVTADADGVVEVTVTLPPATPGVHTVELSGETSAGVDVVRGIVVEYPGAPVAGDVYSDYVCCFDAEPGDVVDVFYLDGLFGEGPLFTAALDPQGGVLVEDLPVFPTEDGVMAPLTVVNRRTGAVVEVAGVAVTPADVVAPVVVGVPKRAPNPAGWYDAAVTVDWEVSDPEPSAGVPDLPGLVVADREGTHTYESAEVCDGAGNCARGAVTVSIDVSPPVVAVQGDLDGRVFGYGTDVLVSCVASDAVSGLDGPCGVDVVGPVVSGGIGTYTASAVARDLAGNTATATVSYGVVVDGDPPTITGTADRVPDGGGWYRGPVVWTFTCADAGSGVAVCPDPVTITAEGAGQSFTVSGSDVVGNVATVTTDGINLDQTPPVPDAGGPYVVAEGATVTLDGSGSFDALSGVADVGWDVDGDGVFDDGPEVVAVDDGVVGVSLRVRDVAGNVAVADAGVTVTNVAPSITSVWGPAVPVAVTDQPVTVGVGFTDPGVADTHTVVWEWGDGTPPVVRDGAVSPAMAAHSYVTPGVYEVAVTVSDDDGGTVTESVRYVVVFDGTGKEFSAKGTLVVGDVELKVGSNAKPDTDGGVKGKFKLFVEPTAGGSKQKIRGEFTSVWFFTDWAVGSGSGMLEAATPDGGDIPVEFVVAGYDGKDSDVSDAIRVKVWRAGQPTMVLVDTQPGAGDYGFPTLELDKNGVKVKHH